MYKIITICLLCVIVTRSKRIDNVDECRYVDNFNDSRLSSNGIEYPSSNNRIASRVLGRLTRAKRSPLMFLVPVNEEHENGDNEMTEKSRPSRKIKRCKAALCKTGNVVPLAREYDDKTLKSRVGESNGEPYVRSTGWKQIRTAKDSVVSKLYKKDSDSRENDDDEDENLMEYLGKNLENERSYEIVQDDREKEGKYVCYCRREKCVDCPSTESKKELVGSSRVKGNLLGRDKLRKDRYRKLMNDYSIPKVPLTRIPDLYGKVPYNLGINHGNPRKIQFLPIVRGIPSNVHPLTVPFRVVNDRDDTYVGRSALPISQRYRQQFDNNNKNNQQYTTLRQQGIASKSKFDIPETSTVSRSNGLSTSTNNPDRNNFDSDEDTEDDLIDSNMRECIRLFGRRVCVLAASTNCNSLNKMIEKEGKNNYFTESRENVQSARDYYETSTNVESSYYRNDDQDYHDVTETDIFPNTSNDFEDYIDDRRKTTERSDENDEDYYDSTVSNVISEKPEYTTMGTDKDYFDWETPEYVDIDPTEDAILLAVENKEKEDLVSTTISNSADSNSTNEVLNESVTYTTENKNDIDSNNLFDDFSTSTANTIEKDSTGTTVDTMLSPESESSSQSENYNDYNLIYDDFSTSSTTDTILGNDRSHYNDGIHLGLDYSDIQVVTNGYFTSKGYDAYDENYLTSLDPSAYDYHLPNDKTISSLENSRSYDTNLQATNFPGLGKEFGRSGEVLPTKSYVNLGKSRLLNDLTKNTDGDTDETTVEDDTNLLEKGRTAYQDSKLDKDDPSKESALQYGSQDSSIDITTKWESEPDSTTYDSSVSYDISSSTSVTNDMDNLDQSTISFDPDLSTIPDTILTTTMEVGSPEDSTMNEEMMTTTSKEIPDEILDSTIGGYPDESFLVSTNSRMNETNSSENDNDSTDSIMNNDTKFDAFEKAEGTSNAYQSESTTEHLPFCDNTLLINSIKTVLNNFTLDSPNPEDPSVTLDIPNNEEELSPEIMEIPNVRSFLSLPQVENVIVKNVKDHLSKVTRLPEDTLRSIRFNEIIRNALKNILGVLPKKKQPVLPPMTVIEHRYRNDQWTTNLATLLPINPSKQVNNQNPLQRMHDHVKNLVFDPAIGPEAAKQNAVQNIIVQAVKHQLETTNGLEVEEDTIRDMVGNVVGKASDEEERENENDYDQEVGSTTSIEDTTGQSSTEDLVKIGQFSSTEITEKYEDINVTPNSSELSTVNNSNDVNSIEITTTVPITDHFDTESTSVIYVEPYSEYSSTEITEKNSTEKNDENFEENQSSDHPNDSDQVTIAIATTNPPTSVSELQEGDDSSEGPDLRKNIENRDDGRTESVDAILETTSPRDVTSSREERATEVSYRDEEEANGNTRKNKGETNETKVLRLPQNSFVETDNSEIGESSSANQERSTLGKEKCRLCKMESCTSTHEIVTKVHKRVKTTTKKYYGAKENNVASVGNPIVSSKRHEEEDSTAASLEEKKSQEYGNWSKSDEEEEDVSTTCDNLSDEILKNVVSDEDLVYEEKISKTRLNEDNDGDDLTNLQNSELYYIGDKVKLPLEIKKLKDGSYALSISKSICENVLKKKCPCCVPLEGKVRTVRKAKINDDTDRLSGTRKSARAKSRTSRQRSRRSTLSSKKSNWDDSISKNELETLTMPVVSFAEKYNLKLNLDEDIENNTLDLSKDASRIGNIDTGSKKRLIERSNKIARNGKNIEERNDDDSFEKIERDTNNPIFERMKFVNKLQNNPELYRQQRAIEAKRNNGTKVITNLLNWFRSLILD